MKMSIKTEHNYFCTGRSYGCCIGSHYIVRILLVLFGLELPLVMLSNDIIHPLSLKLSFSNRKNLILGENYHMGK